jgi:hypothetical protein
MNERNGQTPNPSTLAAGHLTCTDALEGPKGHKGPKGPQLSFASLASFLSLQGCGQPRGRPGKAFRRLKAPDQPFEEGATVRFLGSGRLLTVLQVVELYSHGIHWFGVLCSWPLRKKNHSSRAWFDAAALRLVDRETLS